jgi:hypothetical protein
MGQIMGFKRIKSQYIRIKKHAYQGNINRNIGLIRRY